MQENTQLSLLAFGGLEIDAPTSDVITGKELKRPDGSVRGYELKVDTKKLIAERLDLKGKDNAEELSDRIVAARDTMALKVKGYIASLGNNFTFTRAAMTNNKGIRSLTLRMTEIKRKKFDVSDEQIAKAWNITVEEAAEYRIQAQERAAAQRQAQDVQATVTADSPQGNGVTA